ncbi:MAG: transglycosylase SLT domain-containing protein [Bacteroidia bacterium]|nr:transglycosylase SLT domain-containing protein [Bacteroidia bacterium]MDW8335214.1 transglycosylase SLT domain-containing protein [Bacteroidia bacterium]
MLFIELIRENPRAFEDKVRAIGQSLKIPPDWLMAVMWLESRLNPRAVHFQAGDPPRAEDRLETRAVGLIQFLPSTARALGVSNTRLYGMSAVEQLDYVHKYFAQFAPPKSFIDCYALCFYPAAVGKPDHWTFPRTVARCNPALDDNRDGTLSKGEWKEKVRRLLPAHARTMLFA